MAMTALAPAITRSKEIFAEKTSQVALKLVPDLSDGKQADRKVLRNLCIYCWRYWSHAPSPDQYLASSRCI